MDDLTNVKKAGETVLSDSTDTAITAPDLPNDPEKRFLDTQDDAGGTRLDESLPTSGNEDIILAPGQTIAQKYVTIKPLGDTGTQARIYVAQREGKLYAIKIYKKGSRPAEDLIKALKEHPCPYLAELYDYGYHNDNYYEIYKYYGNGTLEGKGRCSVSFIKEIVVPNLNEGLHFLHHLADKGMIHGDIKPSNIFISDNEDSVVIGDFGISSYMDKRGRLIDDIKGTPEYAPRTLSFFHKTAKTMAYDYGALGLVLIKIATGHSIFEGNNVDQITAKWEKGLEIPDSIEGRLKRLIKGLLSEDEQQRFGYEEVKKWCEGEFLKINTRSLYDADHFKAKKEQESMVFGVFDNKVLAVSNLRELSQSIIGNWEHTKKLMRRENFYDFLEQFGEDVAKEIRECSKIQDEDVAVFHILYRLKSEKRLVFKGVVYGNVKEFIEKLNSNVTGDMERILHEGLFEYFLKQNGYGSEVTGTVNKIISTEFENPAVIPQILYYIFHSEKEYSINGRTVSNIDELTQEITKMSVDAIEKLTHDSKFLAWLYASGFQQDIFKFFDFK